jgi:shikimate dehydrogenase
LKKSGQNNGCCICQQDFCKLLAQSDNTMLHKVGIIGWPIEHSLSPAMQNAAFAALGMTDWHYDKMAISPDILGVSLRELRDHGYVGINVTVPHKEAVMRYVEANERAQRIGAVNTIDFRTNAGTNTDVIGLMDDLAAHGIEVAGQNVIVLGAGGAARAAVYGLAQAGANIAIVNRTPEKAEKLIHDLSVDAMPMTLKRAARGNVSLIVNCTAVGMFPKIDESSWQDDLPFPQGVTLYDMVYRPAVTKLMRQVESAGGRAIGGLGMLARQGAAAFTLWTGREAPVKVMFEALREVLEQKAN